MNIVQRTFEHYRAYHAYGPPRLKYMGILGALTFFAFYFLRFTRPDPQPLDDLGLRLGVLLGHDVNLSAYHLPLDAHPELGNNAQLGLQLGLVAHTGSAGRFGDQEIGFLGAPEDGATFANGRKLAAHVERVLKRPVTLVEGQRPIKNVAWCTGGAQGYFEAAIAAGADAFITGEISEPQAHYAREMGVSFLACGHHATERYGAPAVAAHVAAQLGLAHEFIDIDNPA